MEQEDEDNLRSELLGVLQDLRYLGDVTRRKSAKMLTQIETPQVDSTSIEKVGIQTVNLIKKIKLNAVAYLKSLDQKLNVINSKITKNIINELQSELSNCTEIDEDNTDNKCNSIHKNGQINSLSLRRATTDASQTEDENWIDTMQRTKGESSGFHNALLCKTPSTVEEKELDENCSSVHPKSDNNLEVSKKSQISDIAIKTDLENKQLQYKNQNEDEEIYVISSDDDMQDCIAKPVATNVNLKKSHAAKTDNDITNTQIHHCEESQVKNMEQPSTSKQKQISTCSVLSHSKEDIDFLNGTETDVKNKIDVPLQRESNKTIKLSLDDKEISRNEEIECSHQKGQTERKCSIDSGNVSKKDSTKQTQNENCIIPHQNSKASEERICDKTSSINKVKTSTSESYSDFLDATQDIDIDECLNDDSQLSSNDIIIDSTPEVNVTPLGVKKEFLDTTDTLLDKYTDDSDKQKIHVEKEFNSIEMIDTTCESKENMANSSDITLELEEPDSNEELFPSGDSEIDTHLNESRNEPDKENNVTSLSKAKPNETQSLHTKESTKKQTLGDEEEYEDLYYAGTQRCPSGEVAINTSLGKSNKESVNENRDTCTPEKETDFVSQILSEQYIDEDYRDPYSVETQACPSEDEIATVLDESNKFISEKDVIQNLQINKENDNIESICSEKSDNREDLLILESSDDETKEVDSLNKNIIEDYSVSENADSAEVSKLDNISQINETNIDCNSSLNDNDLKNSLHPSIENKEFVTRETEFTNDLTNDIGEDTNARSINPTESSTQISYSSDSCTLQKSELTNDSNISYKNENSNDKNKNIDDLNQCIESNCESITESNKFPLKRHFEIKDSTTLDEEQKLETNLHTNSDDLDKAADNNLENSDSLTLVETSKLDYISTEHNYSSSNSPLPAYIDSDETDIEKEVNHSQAVQLNKLKNFSLEQPEEVLKLSQNSEKSFEFDISSYENSGAKEQDEREDIIPREDLMDVILEEYISRNPEENEEKLNPDIIPKEELMIPKEETVDDPEDQMVYPDGKDPILSEKVSIEIKTDPKEEEEGTMFSLENELDKQEIEHQNNVDSKEELMDLVLEEFLPQDGEVNSQTTKSSQDTIIYEVNSIKLENCEGDPTIVKEELPEKNLSDEILELLADLPSVPGGAVLSSLENIKDDSNVDSTLLEHAKQCLQELKEDESDFSSSLESDSDLQLSDFSTSSVIDKTMVSANDKETKKKLMEHNMLLECRIRLERMEIPEKCLKKFSKELNDNVDWLCDLDNLSKKRHHQSSPSFDKPAKKKAKRQTTDTETNTETSDSSDEYSSSKEYSSDNSILKGKLKERMDEILAKAICNDLRSSGSSSDSDDSDTDSLEKKQKMENKTNSNKKELSKEEMMKKAWRKDSLLTTKLTDSGSDHSTKKINPNRYEYDTEFNIESDVIDSDSDIEHLREKCKSKLENTFISPLKGNLSDSSDSSDSDSDVQYISPSKPSSDLNETSSPKKGRRHIRSILSDVDLTQETRQAKKEEIERIERLKDRNKIIESVSQSFSSQKSEEDVDPLILDVNEDTNETLVQVDNIITKKMKPHQRDGVKFMWDSCYESLKRVKKHPGSGCILAHCMGLGKTFQVLALVHTLFAYEGTGTSHVLVVCPLSTVNNWRKEVKFAMKGLPPHKHFSVFSIDGAKSRGIRDKYETVKYWKLRKKAILVLGYDCFESLTNDNKLEKVTINLRQRILECLVDPGPDLVVCDEGHLIKNRKTLRSVALLKIKTQRRIVLTGTPLQNNLVEYYHMVNFVKPNLLGNMTEFKTNFVNPISNGQFEDSNDADINLMMKRTHVLHKLLLKTVQRKEDSELEIYLPPMLDHAVFIQLHQVQVDLYTSFLDYIQKLKNDNKIGKRFLADFIGFQHICTHPELLVFMDKLRSKKRKETEVITTDEDPSIVTLDGWWKDKIPVDSKQKIEYGNKLVVLKTIIEECEAIEDKLLVFSQSLGELDLIEHFLKTAGTERCRSWQKGRDYLRMDGTVPPCERSDLCDKFNDENKKNIRLLLMSTKVGGLGLNLTAANRVVIMTVHWNPSYDTQSVFRVYRFGQTKQVYVYRLIALDTIESKVYQRQVTKLAQAHRVVDNHQIIRHYQRDDLQELYFCKPNADCERPTPNVPDDKLLAKVILKLPCIFKFHEHKTLLADRPEDKLSEQELAAAWEDFKNKDTLAPPQPPPPPPSSVSDILPPLHKVNYRLAYNLSTPVYDPTTRRYYIPASQPSLNGLTTNQPTYATASLTTNQVTSGSITLTSQAVPSTSSSNSAQFFPSRMTTFQKRSLSNQPKQANHKQFSNSISYMQNINEQLTSNSLKFGLNTTNTRLVNPNSIQQPNATNTRLVNPTSILQPNTTNTRLVNPNSFQQPNTTNTRLVNPNSIQQPSITNTRLVNPNSFQQPYATNVDLVNPTSIQQPNTTNTRLVNPNSFQQPNTTNTRLVNPNSIQQLNTTNTRLVNTNSIQQPNTTNTNLVSQNSIQQRCSSIPNGIKTPNSNSTPQMQSHNVITTKPIIIKSLPKGKSKDGNSVNKSNNNFKIIESLDSNFSRTAFPSRSPVTQRKDIVHNPFGSGDISGNNNQSISKPWDPVIGKSGVKRKIPSDVIEILGTSNKTKRNEPSHINDPEKRRVVGHKIISECINLDVDGDNHSSSTNQKENDEVITLY